MKQLSFIFIITLIFSGCMGGSGYSYTQSSYQQMHRVVYGLVVETRPIEISDSGGGAILGAVLGGIAGHQIGGGRGKDLATVGGAIAGGLAGSAVNTDSGQELVIKLDSGEEITTVHKVNANNPFMYRSMDRVRIVFSGNQIRRIELAR